jgi:hypothetical protein
LTSDGPNASPSCTFTDTVPLPKKKKTQPYNKQQSNNAIRRSHVDLAENYAKKLG